jgi:hypothetical protein
LYVVGDFAFNVANNDYDFFVARLRLANSELVVVDAIFEDGFE